MENNFRMGIRGPGSLGKLKPIEEPVPSPRQGEVLIRAEKAGEAHEKLLSGTAGGKIVLDCG